MSEEDRIALKKFESMLQSNKVYFFDSEEFEEIIYHYMDLGKINLANKAVDLSLSQHPSSIPLKLIKVELLVFENKLKLAEKLLVHIENIDANIDEIYIQRANILSKSNDHHGAIKQLKKALIITSDHIDVHALLGMEYLFIEQFHLAISHFESCLKLDIEDYAALYNIIYCYDMLDEHLLAIQFLNNYIDENPYSEIAWHQLGRQHLSLKEYNQAIRAFDYAILVDEYFVGAYLEKGKALEQNKEYKQAIISYCYALELDDPTAFTYIQIASCYTKLNDTKFAIDYYLKAIDEDPLIETSWMQLTKLFIDNKEYAKALHYIEKALDVDNDNTEFLNRYAEINIKLNLFEEAAIAFKKSLKNGDKRLVIYLALADILHFIGEYDQVENILLEAYTSFKYAAEVYYRLAGIYFELHKDKEGLFFIEKALKKDFNMYLNIIDLFPEMFDRLDVKNLINKLKLK